MFLIERHRGFRMPQYSHTQCWFIDLGYMIYPIILFMDDVFDGQFWHLLFFLMHLAEAVGLSLFQKQTSNEFTVTLSWCEWIWSQPIYHDEFLSQAYSMMVRKRVGSVRHMRLYIAWSLRCLIWFASCHVVILRQLLSFFLKKIHWPLIC